MSKYGEKKMDVNNEKTTRFIIENKDKYCNFCGWISLWKNILRNWDVSYFRITEFSNYILNTKDLQISFFNNEFFNSGKYAWPSSLYNAKLVIENAKSHTNLYELLLNHPFDQTLSMHKTLENLIEVNPDYEEETELDFQISTSVFAHSEKTQQNYFYSLEISDWNYTQVIVSAICYYLKHIFIENEKLPETIYWQKVKVKSLKQVQKESLLFNVKTFIYDIFVYLMHPETSEILVNVLQQTNIIYAYQLQWINVFHAMLTKIDDNKGRRTSLNPEKEVIHEVSLFRFFKALNFHFIFSHELIFIIIKICIYKGNFQEVRDMLSVYEIFLIKLDLFKFNFFNFFQHETNSGYDWLQENQEHSFSKKIVEKMFLISFLQLQTVYDKNRATQYGWEKDIYFADLVKLLNEIIPSFSLEKIYSINQTEYLRLQKKDEQTQRKKK